MAQTIISKGKAILAPAGLRCNGPRKNDSSMPCHKLLVKKNSLGQVAGSFKCERCGQEINVDIQF